MEWTEDMIKQCARPTGRLGRIVGEEMNKCHYELWQWGLNQISLDNNMTILDVGCGGGAAIKLINSLTPDSRIHGIDISRDMVALSREVNHASERGSLVEIKLGAVSSIPYQDDMFDMVTAFESYYFWPELDHDFKEVLRVLKPGGVFLIVNEAYIHEKFKERNAQWAELLNTRFHTPEEFLHLLLKAGYRSINIIEIPEENWITITSRKP